MSPACAPTASRGETAATEEALNLRMPSEDVDNDLSLDILFEKYLHSPSPSPPLSPKGTVIGMSGVTLMNAIGLVIVMSHIRKHLKAQLQKKC